ncbi:MAG: BRCT domain-containing protein [Deltaproteobacteria bacterium]|nr:BRCT domain-containing protein [Deltaproteobacteria bacterium]
MATKKKKKAAAAAPIADAPIADATTATTTTTASAAKPARKKAAPKPKALGKRFKFIGGFDCSPSEETDGLLVRMIENVGGIIDPEVTAEINYLVVGNRMGPKKQALKNQAQKLIEAGAPIQLLEEKDFLRMVRRESPATPASGGMDFAGFVLEMHSLVDNKKLGKALAMLKKEAFKLFVRVDEAHLVGVVKSQTGDGSVYSPWLQQDGHYGCCQQDLSWCMGLGGVCKHLMVLVIGVVRTNQMTQDQALQWLRGTKGKGPKSDQDRSAQTLLAYKGAEQGTVDWRPTETVPEDFYAL